MLRTAKSTAYAEDGGFLAREGQIWAPKNIWVIGHSFFIYFFREVQPMTFTRCAKTTKKFCVENPYLDTSHTESKRFQVRRNCAGYLWLCELVCSVLSCPAHLTVWPFVY